jgi:hypothetical protein
MGTHFATNKLEGKNGVFGKSFNPWLDKQK